MDELHIMLAPITFAGILNFSLGLIVYWNNKISIIHRLFFIICVTSTLLVGTDAVFRLYPSVDVLKAAFAIGAFLPFFVLLWTLEFTNVQWVRGKKMLVAIPAGLIFLISLTDNLVVKEFYGLLPFGYNADFGYFIIIYSLVIFSYIFYSIYLLAKYRRVESLDSNRVKYVIYGIGLYTVFSILFSVLLPAFHVMDYASLNSVWSLFFTVLTTYAILKHGLFNVKVIVAELATMLIGLVLLTKYILSDTTTAYVVNGTLFFVTILFGITVIRAIMKDIQHRQVIEHLVSQLTIANNRLELLEKQKSEFVSIASHQLRTPLTAIKGYASMMLEGSFGKIGEKVQEPIERIFKSSQKLVMIIENFLTISRIEQGRMIYRFEAIDLKGVVDTIAEELRLNIEQKGLRLDINISKGSVYMVKGDLIKLKQVMHNLLSNSIKHTDTGFIQIEIAHSYQPGKVLLTMSDTGRGLTGQEAKHVFDRRDILPEEGEMQDDTGVELFISQEMIKAHGGRLWAESQGLGQGTSFFMELPESVASAGWYE